MPIINLTTCMSPQTDVFCRSLAAHLSEALDRPLRFVDSPSWEARQLGLDTGDIHLAWICGLPYVKRADQDGRRLELLAAPVMASARYQRRPVYFSDIVVGTNRPHRSLTDLQGAVWAYNERRSFSGHVVVCARLAGVPAHRPAFFRRMIPTGSHLESMRLVLDGQADGAAIDSMVLDLEAARDPGLAGQLRVIESLGPNPAPPWVITTGLPRALRVRIRQIFLSLHQAPDGQALLAQAGLGCFVPVQDGDYNTIRAAALLAQDYESRA